MLISLFFLVILILLNIPETTGQCRDSSGKLRAVGEVYVEDCKTRITCNPPNITSAVSHCPRASAGPQCREVTHPQRDEEKALHCCPVYICHNCTEGRFGTDSSCPGVCHCSRTKSCHIVDGSCRRGDTCVAGYTNPPQCQTPCPSGRYGVRCTKTCRCYGDYDICNKVTGACQSGCKAGYMGKSCDQKCPPGKYGRNCAFRCNCRNRREPCNRVTGACQSHCPPGYKDKPLSCTEKCDNGTWGIGCNSTCNCRSQKEVCDKRRGDCKSKCPPGFVGRPCTRECTSGTFGLDCALQCNCQSNTEVCNRTTGRCLSGCKAGYTAIDCQSKCGGLKFGLNCQFNCSCRNTTERCDHITGACHSGCRDNLQPPVCVEACKDMMFGVNCSLKCHCANDAEPCYKEGGHCFSGCAEGYSGHTCQEKVAPAKANTMPMVIGLSVGLSLFVLVLAGVMFFVIKRCRHKRLVGKVTRPRGSKSTVKKNLQSIRSVVEKDEPQSDPESVYENLGDLDDLKKPIQESTQNDGYEGPSVVDNHGYLILSDEYQQLEKETNVDDADLQQLYETPIEKPTSIQSYINVGDKADQPKPPPCLNERTVSVVDYAYISDSNHTDSVHKDPPLRNRDKKEYNNQELTAQYETLEEYENTDALHTDSSSATANNPTSEGTVYENVEGSP